MLKGDLSNTAGITVGFRCEDFLIEYKDSTFIDKVLNTFMGKVKRAEVKQEVHSFMEHLYRNTEYNVDLIIENKNYTRDLKELLDDLPFNRVVFIDKISQVSSRLLIGDLSYYVDDDTYRRSLVNSKFAVTLQEIAHIINNRR